jgi:mRNA interferase MazF
MKRGELYRITAASGDPKKQRVYVIVSRQELIDSAYSTLVCAPVYTSFEGLSTQVCVGVNEGLKHTSAIRCDELVSILKSRLTNYTGALSDEKHGELNRALAIAVGIEGIFFGPRIRFFPFTLGFGAAFLAHACGSLQKITAKSKKQSAPPLYTKPFYHL